MAKKGAAKDPVKTTSASTIRKRFDDDEGLWNIDVFTMGAWISVAGHCQEVEADDCIADLWRWHQGE